MSENAPKKDSQTQTERPDAVPGVASVLLLSAMVDALAEMQPEMFAKVRGNLDAMRGHPLSSLHPAAARLANILIQNAERKGSHE